jgi:hypothetical protein
VILQGIENPVVQVSNQETGELIYSIRISTSNFKPKVFEKGKYEVSIMNPEDGHIKVIDDLDSILPDDNKTLTVSF